MNAVLKVCSVSTLALVLASCGGSNNIAEPPTDGGPPPDTEMDDDISSLNCSVPSTRDQDGDGLSDCDELNTYGTNPFLSDTDGDSFSDASEVVLFDPVNSRSKFNPLVADLGRISVELTSVPAIELDFTESSGNSRSVATAHGQSDTSSVSRNWGGESSRQLEIGHTVSIENTTTVGVEVSVSPTDLGVTGSLENSLTLGMSNNRTQTTGSSVNWSDTQKRDNSRTFNESEELSQTSGTTYNGGQMSVTARIVNDGNLAYDLENLTLSAFIYDPRRPFDLTPVGNLTFAGGTFPATSITTNSQSSPLNFTTELSLPRARELLRDSRNLVIEPSTYRLLDRSNSSLLLTDQDVSARTSTIIIDYGIQAGREESFRVAVNTGTADRSIKAIDAMQEILGYTVSEGSGSWVYGDEGAPRTTPNGVLSIDQFGMSTETNSYWLAAWNRSDRTNSGVRVTELLNLLDEGYSLDDIDLRAGDTLSFVYVTDRDRDALADRYEDDFGTDKNLADTDGDNLLDAEEIYGWLTNLASPPCNVGEQFRVTSNPLLSDTDADGTDDATEKASCANPNFSVIADAGSDQVVNVGSQVSLNASATGLFSAQPTFTWRQVNGPDVIVDGAATRVLDGRAPSFEVGEDVATLIFDLEVNVEGGTSVDRVVVQVQQDRTQAVFVGTNTDGNPKGTQDSPFPTLVQAMNAISPGDDLYVMTRQADGAPLPYELVNSLNIPDGTDMFGGFDQDWIRQVDTQLTPVTLIASADLQPVFRYTGISDTMHLSGFALLSDAEGSNGADNIVAMRVEGGGAGRLVVKNNQFVTTSITSRSSGVGGSNYAAMISNIAQLQLSNNILVAGNAADAAAGGNGRRPAAAARGSNGSSGSASSNGGAGGKSSIGGTGGRGGDGGNNIVSDVKGDNGAKGVTKGSASGGSGGGNRSFGLAGGRGGAGAAGSAGAAAGDPDTTQVIFTPAKGNTGAAGEPGAGGGGGGGGSMGGTAPGGGGGGGGAGGTGGQPGTGGYGGGASIGLWLDGVPRADMRENAISSGKGGAGGNGGRGSSGGSGGSGGSGSSGAENCFIVCDRGATGASGGSGGSGGAGGDGSGGSGGPSIAIYVGTSMAPVISDNSMTTGQGGVGGSFGHTGNGGDSVSIFDANTDDGVKPVVSNNTNQNGNGGVAGSSPSDGGTAGQAGCTGAENC